MCCPRAEHVRSLLKSGCPISEGSCLIRDSNSKWVGLPARSPCEALRCRFATAQVSAPTRCVIAPVGAEKYSVATPTSLPVIRSPHPGVPPRRRCRLPDPRRDLAGGDGHVEGSLERQVFARVRPAPPPLCRAPACVRARPPLPPPRRFIDHYQARGSGSWTRRASTSTSVSAPAPRPCRQCAATPPFPRARRGGEARARQVPGQPREHAVVQALLSSPTTRGSPTTLRRAGPRGAAPDTMPAFTTDAALIAAGAGEAAEVQGGPHGPLCDGGPRSRCRRPEGHSGVSGGRGRGGAKGRPRGGPQIAASAPPRRRARRPARLQPPPPLLLPLLPPLRAAGARAGAWGPLRPRARLRRGRPQWPQPCSGAWAS